MSRLDEIRSNFSDEVAKRIVLTGGYYKVIDGADESLRVDEFLPLEHIVELIKAYLKGRYIGMMTQQQVVRQAMGLYLRGTGVKYYLDWVPEPSDLE